MPLRLCICVLPLRVLSACQLASACDERETAESRTQKEQGVATIGNARLRARDKRPLFETVIVHIVGIGPIAKLTIQSQIRAGPAEETYRNVHIQIPGAAPVVGVETVGRLHGKVDLRIT